MDLSTCQASVILRGLPLHNFSIGRYELQEAMIISRLCHSLIEDLHLIILSLTITRSEYTTKH